jgi:hypothetical protein
MNSIVIMTLEDSLDRVVNHLKMRYAMKIRKTTKRQMINI